MTDPVELLRRAGRDALATGTPGDVRRIAAALQNLPGGAAEAYFLTGIIEAGAGRAGQAIQLIGKAAALSPSADYQAHLARFLILARRDGEAREAASRAEALEPDDAHIFDTIGCVHARLGAHADAVRLFEQAVEREPANRNFRYNLAVALSFVGQAEQAEEHLDAIVAAAPTDGRAHFALSGLRRQTPEKNHIARLDQALAAARRDDDQIRIRYALAKEYEECGESEGAFHHLQRASAQRRQETGYAFAQDARIFDAVESLFRSGDPLVGSGDATVAPIFVVGMPRTGTTLVERILSSHADVQSAGELTAMPLAVKQLADQPTGAIIDPDTFAATRGRSASDLGRHYLTRCGPHLRADGGRFVDKLPANFLYIGLIQRALPDARIICLRRDPMDTIWSNYKHLFARNSAFHHYSYDLIDTARYYLRFDRLMSFWREVFPGRVLELGYEALVSDQTGETRRLLDHCGLRWDERCLRFQENQGAVATPSAAQVRQPIYADAVGQWRAYAEALGPARKLIEDAGIEVD
ncbi:thioredoxin-like negative regulator of GroEL [Sphingopyxis panaciterrae]|uniref:tetratricopeptide repeat-containing sulfotransferase family protein n=1 Tax=Sphingopyxis panaciterrae TaxID=363841 RepID=UPI001422A852|nr:sulfotransferase [Sphingopyxis panaciterrae]NIJ38466.1 thioredoxin-like negative regulator of GroEL [Sphingopyxis panaciterrae]